ncbi:MAG: signal peptide peptidase SppA [Chitinophagaceae bacterium]|nr:signal peptide peptidase SppA [Chitinophagaceae bacterium]
MQQFFKILFATLLALVLFTIIGFVSLIGIAAGASSAGEETVIEDNSVLMLDMNDPVMEQGSKDPFAALSNAPTHTMGLNQIILSLKEAKTDDRIKGVYIKTGVCPVGWATLQEIRSALIDFKSSKKFIYAYGEIADQKSYYIASVSDHLYMNPIGGIEFNGLSLTGTFYKGTLDKLDITTEAFHCGKYKGAYEPYKLDKFSEPNRYQLGVLLSDLYSTFLQAVSQKTGTDTATLSKMANEGLVKFPKDAVANKLIDGVLYADSVEKLIKKELALKEKEKISFVSPDEYAEGVTSTVKSKDKIAIIYAEGAIYDGEGDEDIHSKDMTKVIRKIGLDETIKAVVLRVNSPGGSALASEVIYHELMELRKKKPIVVSMGNYAASGGYYISCAADSIFADENTLTGSIGVVGVMFNVGDMMKNKLGVTTDVVKTGTYSDFPNMMRPMTDGERTWIQSYLDTTYNLFKSRVAMARNLTMEQVEELAQGHVYSGRLAKDLKLVDGFGNVDRALQSVAGMAKLKTYKIVEYPKPVDKIEMILSSLSGKKREDAAIKKMLGEDYKVYQEVQKIRSQQNQIQAIMPWQIDIR